MKTTCMEYPGRCRGSWLITLFLILGLSGFLWSADAQEEEEEGGEETVEEVVPPLERVEFVQLMPGFSMAKLWGQPEAGPYGSFIQIERGRSMAPHQHAHDTRVVVIAGTFIYNGKRFEPGSYLHIPGGKEFRSGAGPDEACVLYVNSDDPFKMLFRGRIVRWVTRAEAPVAHSP